MNRERQRYWEAYIADLQGRMVLGNWIIAVDTEPAPPGANASVGTIPGQHVACINFCKDFDGLTRAAQRQAAVHELVHLHLASLEYHLAMQGGEREDEVNVRERIRRAHTSHEEYAVADLARIIAPSMPLPPKVKP